MSRGFALVALCAVLIFASLAGCAPSQVAQEDETTTDLQHIARAYEVVMLSGGSPPRNVEQIEKVLGEFHTAGLNPPAQEVLVSARDGQPYVIILQARLGTGDKDDVLFYEKIGLEGKRYVLFMSRDVRQLSEVEFKQARFAMGHKPSAS